MILVDTGPLIALFDPADKLRTRCRKILRGVKEPLCSSVPVLTETFHMRSPVSQGADKLREFIGMGGLSVWYFDDASLERALELMERYKEHPMDLADASLVVAAEVLRTRNIFTIDRDDFETYRVKRGYRHYPMEIVH